MAERFVLTGGDGFLGWHTRLAIHSEGSDSDHLPVGDYWDEEKSLELLDGSDHLIHLAGVNRGSDEEVQQGNVRFAEQVAGALREVASPPRTVTYSNSIQAQMGGVYGDAKAEAGSILREAAHEVGAEYRELLLPNLYGEHGRPFYNSVVSTFCYLIATQSGAPKIEVDRELGLLHAQDAADWLVGAIDEDEVTDLVTNMTVSDLLSRLEKISDCYRGGEVPDLSTDFGRNLFNTYRSYLVGEEMPFALTRHADERGSFFEVIRTHGGDGQSSFSTTEPDVRRGDHYHRRKVERFTALSGHAEISMRRLFTDDTLSFAVSGDVPMAIDIPTGWTHDLKNTGYETLYMHFWTNDLFDPENPDTFAEEV